MGVGVGGSFSVLLLRVTRLNQNDEPRHTMENKHTDVILKLFCRFCTHARILLPSVIKQPTQR